MGEGVVHRDWAAGERDLRISAPNSPWTAPRERLRIPSSHPASQPSTGAYSEESFADIPHPVPSLQPRYQDDT